MSFDWKGLLGSVAPVLGTAIGGPFGALAGAAINAVLGIDPDSDEAAMAEAIKKATPEQLLALQNAERQFKLDMEKLNVDIMKIDASDRDSARRREVETKDFIPRVLGTLCVSGFFGTVGYVLLHGLGEMDQTHAILIGNLIGYVSAKAEQVIAYYFGSSAGSSEKSKMLAQSMPVK